MSLDGTSVGQMSLNVITKHKTVSFSQNIYKFSMKNNRLILFCFWKMGPFPASIFFIFVELEGKIKIADDWIRTGNPTAQQTYWFWVIFFFSFPNFNLLFCSLVLHKPLMIFSRRRWTNWIGPTVKHVWKAATHVLHNFWGFVENATAYHLDQYSHNRHLIKSSMDKLFPLLRIEHRDD